MPQYNGQIVELPLGINGLETDDPDSALQAGNLIRARNVNYQNGAIEKAVGAMRWNSSPLGVGIRAGLDWWPDDQTQRLIALGLDGNVYRYTNPEVQGLITPGTGAPLTLNTSQFGNFVTGGAEQGNNPRKIFVMTGYDPIQSIESDSTVRNNISNPVGDFSGTNQPLDGVIFRGMFFVFLRNSHNIYASSALDHEDFASFPLPYSVYPGESERVSCLFVFRTKLFALKYPRGLYSLVDTDPSAQNWYFQKVTGSFGAPGGRCAVPVFNDTYVATEYGGIMSLQATNATGDVTASDIFAQLRVKQFVRDFILQEGRGIRQGIYFAEKQIAYFVFRGRTSIQNDWILGIDFSNASSPKICWRDTVQPNCLFLRKDITGVERPFYGANDGYFYFMDSPNAWIGSIDQSVENGYEYEFQTPHFDLAQGNPAFGDANKNWEFVQLMYVPCGKWNINFDIYLDGKHHKKGQIEVGGRSDLDIGMVLDVGTTEAEVEVTSLFPVQGLGKRVSFRFYDDTPGHTFKITKLRVWYKMSGMQDSK
jgi:hypothetical protein